jgi:hypothetical protein
MTTTTHTPGPWFIGASPEKGYRAIRVNDPGCTHGRIIAAMVEPDDAHLIAAAPEMLAALRTIANSEQCNGDSFVCDFETLQSVARAAIAKAEGRAS